MGINLEFVATLAEIRSQLPREATVIELGAQDISADPSAAAKMLSDFGFKNGGPINTAAELYNRSGFSNYDAIDISGGPGNVHPFDLNLDLATTYGFTKTFDLVTNLGTLEHCFDQASGFRNMHRLTKTGGMMIHCLPSQGLVNHAFYNYHPRFIAELAKANGYEISRVFMTADFTPKRVPYTIENFQSLDGRDVLFYTVIRKVTEADFKNPSDSMFTDQKNVLAGEYRPYVKAPWSNTLADNS